MSNIDFLKPIQNTEYIMDIDKLLKLSEKILPLFTSDLRKTYAIFDDHESESAFIYLIALFVYYYNILTLNEAEEAIKEFIYSAFKKNISIQDLRGVLMQNANFDKYINKDKITVSLNYIYNRLIEPDHTGLEENYKKFFAEYILNSIKNALSQLSYHEEIAGVYELKKVEEMKQNETPLSDPILDELESKFVVRSIGKTININTDSFFSPSPHPNLKNQTFENLLRYIIPIIENKLNNKLTFPEAGRLVAEVIQYINNKRNLSIRGIKSINIELGELNNGSLEIAVEVILKWDGKEFAAYVQYAQVDSKDNVIKSGIKQILTNPKFLKWKDEERSSFNEG